MITAVSPSFVDEPKARREPQLRPVAGRPGGAKSDSEVPYALPSGTLVRCDHRDSASDAR
jgi:hypothetical protein